MTRRWDQQRVLVTGASGFLGGHLVEALKARGAAHIVGPRSAECDLTDRAATRRLFGDGGFDVVFHLAARVGGIGAHQRHPGGFFHDNMAIGLNVLDEARRAGVARTVLVGTTCSYPRDAPLPLREDQLWQGYPEPVTSAYGIAKRALIEMARAYRAEYGTDIVTVIPVNLYGPRDVFDADRSHVVAALIDRFVRAAERRDPEVLLWGDGSATREFLYVTDAAEGLVCAAESLEGDGPVNLGTGVETPVRALAEKIALLSGFHGRLGWDPTRPNGQPRRAVDTALARERMGFEARVSLDEGLARTLAWWRAHRPT